ncbi:hypothetical protein AB0N93_38460 [Streptomyces sp. NPDC091267]|uniref:hypothetical protein n=1 Tax=unclassified Streptomyces TaxID=2593676 RepID=UPI00344115B5
MRRIAPALGGLFVAGVLALSLAGSAWGATGTLAINGVMYEDPAGCYTPTPDAEGVMTVVNGTDEVAYVYDEQGCSGNVVGFGGPGSLIENLLGRSVRIA